MGQQGPRPPCIDLEAKYPTWRNYTTKPVYKIHYVLIAFFEAVFAAEEMIRCISLYL